MYCLCLPQGVTLAELKEAQRTNSLSPLDRDRQTEDGHSRLTDRSCLRGRGSTEDRGEARSSLAQYMETEDHSPTWSREIDEVGIKLQSFSINLSPQDLIIVIGYCL